MKYILHIAAHLYIGGAEKVVRDICYYTDTAEYENHIIIFDEDIGVYGRELEAKGARIFKFSEPSRDYRQYYLGLKALMEQYRYTAVHAHTMFSIGWVMLAAKKMHVPVRVSHAHSALMTEKRFIKSIYEFTMRKLILANATDLVACGNKAGERLYGKKAFRKRGNLILNGIDTAAFRYSDVKRAAIREQLGLENHFVIGHTGHLAEVKNQSFLIEMMPELLKRHDNTVLLLLGEGEERPMLEEKIRTLGLQEKVIMTGNVNNVSDYLSAMDVFVFPSLYEGMPLSILEVQANGLPCVISDRVPPDVFLTDLIHPLSLDDPYAMWVDMICRVRRENPALYAEQMKEAGFDVLTAVEKIYRIYDRGI